MDPMTIAMLLGTALKAKGDVDTEKADRMEAGVKQSVSPWSGVAANSVRQADPFGTIAGGVGSALAQGQAATAADQQMQQNQYLQDYKDKQLGIQNKWLDLAQAQSPNVAPEMQGDMMEANAIGARMRQKRAKPMMGF